jgi:hypothetical protein
VRSTMASIPQEFAVGSSANTICQPSSIWYRDSPRSFNLCSCSGKFRGAARTKSAGFWIVPRQSALRGGILIESQSQCQHREPSPLPCSEQPFSVPSGTHGIQSASQ